MSEEKSRYYHVEARERAGDFETISDFAVALDEGVDINDALDAYFGSYYGPETTPIREGRWGGAVADIEIHGVSPVTETEYGVLAEHLSTIPGSPDA